jgi:two-component system, NtrC family, nitrogen regulation sensor histidine kinase NtrY
MNNKNFRFRIIFRSALLALSIAATVLLAVYTPYIFTSVIAGIVSVVQVILLVRYVEETNKKLIRFFDSIEFSDFTATFSQPAKGKSFDELSKKFNEVIEHFRASTKEREEHYNYLHTVVEHISIGIIVFRKNGTVDLVNNSFRKLLRIQNLKEISELKKVDEQLAETIVSLKSGNSCMKKLFVGNELLQLSVYATEFRMRGEEYMLVSVQNIHNELEEKEIESWQKLTRVLTHEIMNSITPISSLASSVNEMVTADDGNPRKIDELDEDALANIQSALNTIEKRSGGLLNFVDIYRNLTRVPKPNFRHFQVRELFNRVASLFQVEFDKKGIRLECQLFPEQITLTADPDLIEQVLINLVLNSIYALRETKSPVIKFIAATDNGSTYIQVIDNGSGITEDLMDKIFIPFFTSRKDGSGIGLSLSRQILHLHKGSIYVRSTPGLETIFTLAF